ncbi:MAG TPA: hypothetical protein VM070_03430 [Candidatus Saccharimonadales bacterium]|nr:hypothetical protein [Candidatus Saccharimonadales bacterium]
MATLPAWSLKLGAACITLASLAGSFDYASTHVKNVTAPLQPPVADRPAASASPSPSPVPSIGALITLRPGQRTAAPGSAAPRLSLEPGVRTATLAPLTFTHVS